MAGYFDIRGQSIGFPSCRPPLLVLGNCGVVVLAYTWVPVGPVRSANLDSQKGPLN